VAAVRSRVGSIVVYLVLALTGLASGLVGVFVQALSVRVGPVPVRYGVAVAAGGAIALFVLGRLITSARAGVVVPAAGWLLAILPFTVSRPEGDTVLAGNGPGAYIFLFMPTLAAATLATLPTEPPRRTR
jgi:Family of unknown function (DUF6113)